MRMLALIALAACAPTLQQNVAPAPAAPPQPPAAAVASSPIRVCGIVMPKLATGPDANVSYVLNKLLDTFGGEQDRFVTRGDGKVVATAAFAYRDRSQTVPLAATLTFDQDGGLEHAAPGKRADLVILSADPLADIHDIRKIDRVIARGKIYDARALWKLVGFGVLSP